MTLKHPDIILKDLIEAFNVLGSTLINAIERLENRGLIARVISKRDRRSFGLKLTEGGKVAVEEHISTEMKLAKSMPCALESMKKGKCSIS